MRDSFWKLTEGGSVNGERAVEIIRRCSSAGIFKQVMTKLGSVIEYARRIQLSNPLFVEGNFDVHEHDTTYNGIPARVVTADIKISNESGDFIIQSHFFMVVSKQGRIIGLRNTV